MSLTRTLAICLSFILVSILGCSSSSKNAISPDVPLGLTLPETGYESNRSLWGMWSLRIDPEMMTIDAEPLRHADAHYFVDDCDDCLDFVFVSFDPQSRIARVDVFLLNPTQLTVYDVRGILFSNDYGHELYSAHGWTPLFDIPGGYPINPYMIFGDYNEKFVFPPEKIHIIETMIYIPNPPETDKIVFGIDVSWPGNCKEPAWLMSSVINDELTDEAGSSFELKAYAGDWQDDINPVQLLSPEFTGGEWVDLEPDSWIEDYWTVDIVNDGSIPPGDYKALLRATSANSGPLACYWVMKIRVSDHGVPYYPENVTPTWLRLQTSSIDVSGNYLFATGDNYGLEVFDISNPTQPVHADFLNFAYVSPIGYPYELTSIVTTDELAYLWDQAGIFYILDINPMESAHVISTLESYGEDMIISGGYAYSKASQAIVIVDIDPPEDVHHIETVSFFSVVQGFDVSGSYAYAATEIGQEGRLVVADIDPPDEAHEVIHIDLTGNPTDVSVAGDYAYVTTETEGIHIVDISDPELPFLVDTLSLPGTPVDIRSVDGYAYVINESEGMQIIDIDPPGTAQLIGTVHPGNYDMEVMDIAFKDGYAYLGTTNTGLLVVDINPPEDAAIVGSFESYSDAKAMAVDGDYAYILDRVKGLCVADISVPDEAWVISSTGFMNWYINCIDAENDIVCIGSVGLDIIDVSQPEFPQQVTNVGFPNLPSDVVISNGFAYAIAYDELNIVDIDPPGSAAVVHTLDLTYYMQEMAISSDFLYIVDSHEGIHIVDIQNPETAFLVNTFYFEYGAYDIDVVDDIAYVTISHINDALYLIDVSNALAPFIIGSYPLTAGPYDIDVSGGYAYIPSFHRFVIYDIDPPGETYEFHSLISLDGWDITVQDNYAYIIDDSINGRVKIIKLW